MAERLTEKNTVSVYNNSNSEIYLGKGEEATKYIYKLAQFEDIMEKYGIESVEELDKKIGHYIDKIDLEAENDYLKKVIEKQNIVTQIISKNRDTWKRACELACKWFKQTGFIGDQTEVDYYYQQAKKEKK